MNQMNLVVRMLLDQIPSELLSNYLMVKNMEKRTTKLNGILKHLSLLENLFFAETTSYVTREATQRHLSTTVSRKIGKNETAAVVAAEQRKYCCCHIIQGTTSTN